MKNIKYPPEGGLFMTAFNKEHSYSRLSLGKSAESGIILEGRAFRCSEDHDLFVKLPGGMVGVIPFDEAVGSNVREDSREIAVISRVGKYVCFKVIDAESEIPVFSRKAAQIECAENSVENLLPGDIIDAVVTHMEPFGAFCDIGCGIIALLPIDAMSVSRINHPRDRFFPGQKIKAVIKSKSDDGRITLTHKELLGTWEENASRFLPGQAVTGVVRSVEKYGVFVELAPNLAGLAEHTDDLVPGDIVSVYIKSVIPQKMKIKLVIIDKAENEYSEKKYEYFIKDDTVKEWHYSPEGCLKQIITVF